MTKIVSVHPWLLVRIVGLVLCGFGLFVLAQVKPKPQISKPAGEPKGPATSTRSPATGPYALIETDKGTIQIQLLARAAPKAVKNFRLLAMGKHYDGLTFHRIIKGFMIQGGDPKGDGTGGESIWGGTFKDEIDPASPLYQDGYHRGVVAMANSGPDTNGSQFFIMHQDYRLPPHYVIFGKVISGIEVVDALVELPTKLGADGNMSQPVQPVVMRKVTIRNTRPSAGSTSPAAKPAASSSGHSR